MPSARFRFDDKGLAKLLHQGRLEVPPNQRSYKWDEKHVRDLLQDLNEAITGGAEDYFLGTVVLIQAEVGDVPQIADGQQRLATTTILLARIRDRLIQIKREGSARSVDGDFVRTVDRDTEENVPRLKLNTEDDEYFRNYILAAPGEPTYSADQLEAAASRPSNKRLLRASLIVSEFLSGMLASLPPAAHADHLLRWVRFIENGALVIVVTVADEIGAYRMFETLNDRGLRASQADILKNYLLSKARNRIGDAQAMWNMANTTIEGIGDERHASLTTFVRHLWVTTHGQTKDRELAGALKAEITTEQKAMGLLNDMATSVHDYASLWSDSHAKWAGYKPTVRRALKTIVQDLGIEQIRPLMFAVARHFDPEETEKAFRLFVSWSVRFLIYGGRGGLLDEQYSDRAKDVGTKQITKARELREAMSKYVPTDKQFEEAFANARVSRPRLARYYLRAIDKTLKGDEQPEYVANEEEGEINLEHVMPLEPGEGWDADPDLGTAVQRLLGNMVLLKADKNRDLGALAFPAKREAFAQSAYAVTKQVAEYDDWGLDEIRDRQADLAKIAVKTWTLSFA